MYGFTIVELSGADEMSFNFMSIPYIDTFKILTTGKHSNLKVNIIFEAEDKENNIYSIMDQRIKNLRIYLHLFTDNKINIKTIRKTEIYPDRKVLERPGSSTFLKFLQDPNLSKFLDHRFTQQHIMLQTALNEISRKDIFNGFPKLVNWLDDNAGNGVSRFCCIRDSCDHGILDKNRAIRKVNKLFPGEFEFEDSVLKRNSPKNIQSLVKYLPEVLEHIKKTFREKYII